MKRIFDVVSSAIKTRSRKSSRTSAPTQSSRLRCEALEERTVLSLTPCAALLETAVLDTTSALFSEDAPEFDAIAISLTPSSATSAPLSADELFEEASAIETTALEQAVLDPANQTLEEVDEFFARVGFYINGRPYVPLQALQAYQVEHIDLSDLDARYSNGGVPANYFLPSMFSSDSDDSYLSRSGGDGSGGGSGGGSGEVSVMAINLQGTFVYDSSCSDFTSFTGTSGTIHEGHNSPIGVDQPSWKDYVEIVLPALPYNYYSHVSVGGVASQSDYVALVGYDPNMTSFNGGFDHSGGSTIVYIVPVDDCAAESDETIDLIMGTPAPISQNIDYDVYRFDETCMSVRTTIRDNDNWRAELSVVREAFAVGDVVINEQYETQVPFFVARVDSGLNRSGDLHYGIEVKISLSGDAVFGQDYALYNNDDPQTSISTETLNGATVFTISIAPGSIGELFYVKALDDAIVERAYETIVMTVVSAKCTPIYFDEYLVDATPSIVKILDDDAIVLETVRYYNIFNLVSDTNDASNPLTVFGAQWGNLNYHWRNGHSEDTVPVAYPCTGKMSCLFTTSGTIDPTVIVFVRYKWDFEGDNGATEHAYSNWIPLGSNSTYLTLQDTFKALFGNKQQAYCDLNSTLTWEFYVEDDRDNIRGFGQSVNPLYITYKTPLYSTTPLYHSVVHLGCVAAHRVDGTNNESAVFNAIWHMFENRQIHKMILDDGEVVDDELLTYYGRDPSDQQASDDIVGTLRVYEDGNNGYVVNNVPSLAREVTLTTGRYEQMFQDTTGYDLKGLLKYFDGTCVSWMRMASNVFKDQGIMVNDCKIGLSDAAKGNGYHDFHVDPSTPGQGATANQVDNQPRENIWSNHFVIKYNNYIYDPSYGIRYEKQSSNESDLETIARHILSIGTSQPFTDAQSQAYSDGYRWIYVPRPGSVQSTDIKVEIS